MPKLERKLDVSQEIRDCEALIRRKYGGILTHDSGHAIAPTWIFTFDRHHRAQVAVRMNKHQLSMYLRDKMPDGMPLSSKLAALDLAEIKKLYGPTVVDANGKLKQPANGLLHDSIAPFLNPRRNSLVLISPKEGKSEQILDMYLLSVPDDRLTLA